MVVGFNVASVFVIVASVIVIVIIISVVTDTVVVDSVAFNHHYKEELIIYQNLTMIDSDRSLGVCAGNFS
jgi:hypothetical protein